MDWRSFPVSEAAKLVSCWTGANLVVSEAVKSKKLTLVSPRRVPKARVWATFQALLRGHGLRLRPNGAHWVIDRYAGDRLIRYRCHRVRASALARLIVRLTGLVAVASAKDDVVVFEGSAEDQATVLRWLNWLDRGTQRLYWVRLRHRPPDELARLLLELFPTHRGQAAIVPLERHRALLIRVEADLWPRVYQAIARLDQASRSP